MQEQELVKQLQQGSREAFDQLYLLYHQQAYRTAFFLTGNRADAQDVVQETFVKVWLCAPQLKDCDGFRSWFYRILTRMAFRKGSAQKREIPDAGISLLADRGSEGDSLSGLLLKEEREQIRQAVDSLDEKYRTVVVLYYFNEFSTKEIARITGCLEGTVKSRLFAARRKLQKSLQAGLEPVGSAGINSFWKGSNI